MGVISTSEASATRVTSYCGLSIGQSVNQYIKGDAFGCVCNAREFCGAIGKSRKSLSCREKFTFFLCFFLGANVSPFVTPPNSFATPIARRWEAEHCDESGGGALRGGPLGRMSYQPVPVGRSTVSLDTLYGKLLYAIGERAALELWKKLAVEDWLVRTISR